MGQLRYGRECYQPHKQKEQQEGISILRCRHRGDKIKARGHWEQEPLWAHLMEADTMIAKTRVKRREKCLVFSRHLSDPWWRFTLASSPRRGRGDGLQWSHPCYRSRERTEALTWEQTQTPQSHGNTSWCLRLPCSSVHGSPLFTVTGRIL